MLTRAKLLLGFKGKVTRAEDGCRLWTAETGRGAPLILCHGGPGLWDMFGSLAGLGLQEPFQRAIAERLAPYAARRGELQERDRTEAEDRELAVLQWSADFTGADAVRHAEEMATPWFGVNWECYSEIWGELKRTWREADPVAECQALSVPVLIIDGAADLRPRWAVDSLEQALPV